jgi:POTRA domain-containing FtsQ-type protein
MIAGLALLATSGGLYALTVRDEFRLDPSRVTIDGAVYTPAAAVSAMLGLDSGARPNIFRLRTVDLADALRELPAVLDADVDAILPDRLAIRLHERTPILEWRWGDDRMLVDVEGVMFARLAPGAAPPPGLPAILDGRARPTPPSEGERIDAVDFEAIRLLAAVTPEMLRSRATALAVNVDDVEGFTIDARPGLWHAVFGFYTSQLRSTDLIPGQVQCLGALLGASEPGIKTVILSPADGRCGTFRMRPGASPPSGATPRPSAAAPRPSAAGSGSGTPSAAGRSPSAGGGSPSPSEGAAPTSGDGPPSTDGASPSLGAQLAPGDAPPSMNVPAP